MNCNNSKYDYPANEVLIDKGIECRQFLHNIHSGVRVKVQRKHSLLIEPVQSLKLSALNQTNRAQTLLKRLWFESETSTLSHNSSENQSFISYQTKPIFNHRSLKKNHLLGIKQSDQNVNSIGIQTTMIRQIDREISCNLVKSIPILTQKNRSSATSITDTSASTSNSTETSTVSSSTTTTDTNKNDNHHTRSRRRKNRNNNAIATHIKPIDMKEFKMEKSLIQLSNNEQPWKNVNNNTQCYPQLTSMIGKKRFLDTFSNVISFLRLSSFKCDRVSESKPTIEAPIVTKISENEKNKNIRSPTSRCRRSAARNFNHNSPIELEKHCFQIRSEENSSSKHNHLVQKASIHSVSEKSRSTRKQCRQADNSSLSIVDSHRSKEKSSKTTRRRHLHKKRNYTNRHDERKYLHRNKRKDIHTSNRSSHAQWSIPPIVAENQPLSSADDQSKVLVGKCIKSSIDHTKDPNNNCLSSYEEAKQTSVILSSIKNHLLQREILSSQQPDLLFKPVDKLLTKVIEDKRHFSPPTNSIRLRVKNKNLISNLSKSKIPFSSIYSKDYIH